MFNISDFFGYKNDSPNEPAMEHKGEGVDDSYHSLANDSTPNLGGDRAEGQYTGNPDTDDDQMLDYQEMDEDENEEDEEMDEETVSEISGFSDQDEFEPGEVNDTPILQTHDETSQNTLDSSQLLPDE